MSNIAIVDSIRDNLENLIKITAEREQVIPYTQNPDFLDPRIKKWHQFGLLTHTLYIQEVFSNEAQRIIKEADISDIVNMRLAEKIVKLTGRNFLDLSPDLKRIMKEHL